MLRRQISRPLAVAFLGGSPELTAPHCPSDLGAVPGFVVGGAVVLQPEMQPAPQWLSRSV